jgi:hypothetical protein
LKTEILNAECNNKKIEDKQKIDELVKSFFSLFTIKKGCKADLSYIYQLFIHEGLIVKCSSSTPEVYNLLQFIEPREKMFNDGSLSDFIEEEIFERTEIFGNIAHRLSLYKKSGLMNGKEFKNKGIKTMQFIKTTDGWKISSVAWDDEREEFKIDDKFSW